MLSYTVYGLTLYHTSHVDVQPLDTWRLNICISTEFAECFLVWLVHMCFCFVKEEVLAPPPENDDVVNDFDIEEEVIEVENRYDFFLFLCL